ncbi:YkvI family membrane protein [Corynebacterium sp. A21]|uniref:YkvI family membrane protein n=1 Tax=Corynebacterium sp. A21 TaxID=3457318 RepID=UPI003FCF5A0F
MGRIMQILKIAMAFVGIIVGAGFASGQEVMQYFVAFGIEGIWGAIISGFVMTVMAMIILQLGSYFRAGEHGEVFKRVTHPIFSRILDIGVVVTLFSTGFVMFAGAGSNMQQQWGLPIWVGAIIMLLLVLAAGMLDVEKVTTLIGVITPFILAFIMIASVYTLITADIDVSRLDAAALDTVDTTLPHWAVAAVNYVGFNLMVAVSMAIVIGGTMFSPRWAGIGGLAGGLIYSIMLLISALTLFAAVETVGTDALPMLTIINQLNPWLGQAMAVVIYGMIFNTALGMFYALGKRLTASNPDRFRVVYIIVTLVGFVLSFIGFQTLVAYVYPVLGYIGLLLIAVMTWAWFKGHHQISEESGRRARLKVLLGLRDHGELQLKDEQELTAEVAASNLPAGEIERAHREDKD